MGHRSSLRSSPRRTISHRAAPTPTPCARAIPNAPRSSIVSSRFGRRFAPVRMLNVSKLRGHLPALLGEPMFAQLVALDVGENGLVDADIAAIAAAPALRGLVVLRIAGNLDCGYPSLRALANLPALRFVDADDTRTPLRIATLDAVSGHVELDYTAAQGVMEDDLGALPWLQTLVRPSNHAL